MLAALCAVCARVAMHAIHAPRVARSFCSPFVCAPVLVLQTPTRCEYSWIVFRHVARSACTFDPLTSVSMAEPPPEAQAQSSGSLADNTVLSESPHLTRQGGVFRRALQNPNSQSQTHDM